MRYQEGQEDARPPRHSDDQPTAVMTVFRHRNHEHNHSRDQRGPAKDERAGEPSGEGVGEDREDNHDREVGETGTGDGFEEVFHKKFRKCRRY